MEPAVLVWDEGGFPWDTGFKMLIENIPDKSEGVELFSLDLLII